PIRGTEVLEALPLGEGMVLAIVRVAFSEGEPEVYTIPLGWANGEAGADLWARAPHAVVCRLHVRAERSDDPPGVVFDALADAARCTPLLEAIRDRRQVRGASGELVGTVEAPGETLGDEALEPRVVKSEHGN